jgi:hypothetical protein
VLEKLREQLGASELMNVYANALNAHLRQLLDASRLENAQVREQLDASRLENAQLRTWVFDAPMEYEGGYEIL